MDTSNLILNAMLSADKPNFVSNEELVLAHWNKIKAFEQQLEKSKDLPPFTFYDGPPFATGTPHYGHICAGTIKDVVTRYATMKGHYVERRFGWDCHGLPIENLIDKELKIENRRQIIEMGVDKYNQHCRDVVMKYSNEWRVMINRLGRWIDFDNDYKTMDPLFMESVWSVFKRIFDKGLVYKGCKVMPYSNKCNTVLSNFEAGQNYQEVTDPSVVVSFPLKDDPEVSFLAWTTTPWTLPSNLALSVNPDFEYVKVLDVKLNRKFILAKCRLVELYKSAAKLDTVDKGAKEENKINRNKNEKKKPKKETAKDSGKEPENKEDVVEESKKETVEKEFEILESFSGKSLEFKEYVPLFDYYYQKMQPKGCFRVLCGHHVTSEAGTGIVHTAPAFGEEDYKICMNYKVIEPADPCISVDPNGHYLPLIKDWAGEYIKDCDKRIVAHLKQQQRLIRHSDFKHSYPLCWRSNTPLIYKAVDAWFINVVSIREQLVKNNLKAYWVPSWAQEKRFNNWLETAVDWCFSRDRFWGNPVPLWVSDDGEEVVCIGSVAELRQKANLPEDFKLTDLHKEFVDQITIPSSKGKGTLRRVSEVFDCWFESGSMPYASVGYPFVVNEDEFSKRFPADFIGEGLDQTRGWFYTLNVLGTILFDSCPYKNLIVNGIVLNEKGEKLSKSKKNYPDPWEMINSVGSDSLRLYLMNSPLVRGENLCFNKAHVESLVKDFFNPWFNLVRLLLQELKRFEMTTGTQFHYDESLFRTEEGVRFENILDRWILAKTHALIKFIAKEFAGYRLYTVLDEKLRFLDQLSHWYSNLNKTRFKGDQGVEETRRSLNVLFHCLLNSTIMMAPFVPFNTDYFFLHLKKFIDPKSPLHQNSVHFLRFPSPIDHFYDDLLVKAVEVFQSIVTAVRRLRETRGVNMKQPVSSLKLMVRDSALAATVGQLSKYLREECNVAELVLSPDFRQYVDFNVVPKHEYLGQTFKDKYGVLRPKLMSLTVDQRNEFLATQKLNVEIDFKGDKIVLQLDEQALGLVPFVTRKASTPETEMFGNDLFAFELDFKVTEELRLKGLGRELTNRVQRLRKSSKLAIDDRIFIVLHFPPESVKLAKAFASERTSIQSTVKKPLFRDDETKINQTIFEEDFVIDSEKVKVMITSEFFLFDWKMVESVCVDAKFFDDVVTVLKGINFVGFRESGKQTIEFSLRGHQVQFQNGKHFKMDF